MQDGNFTLLRLSGIKHVLRDPDARRLEAALVQQPSVTASSWRELQTKETVKAVAQ
ncbi:hypothetical protein [Mesorhizobium sp. WSM2239]|uniref:Uncharacterized protein n=1 Tax=Mesorhizobium sp. WSM2239 TaxID=3228852 RepID=A0AAU8D626_9HYPH